MALLSLKDVSFGFDKPLLLEHVDLQIEPGERVCLLGRNGSGKSTLMKLLIGDLPVDDGVLERQAGLKIARQIQEVPVGRHGTIFDEVAAGLGKIGPAIATYHREQEAHEGRIIETPQSEPEDGSVAHVDVADAWKYEQQVIDILGRMQLEPSRPFEQLSSGMKRRVLLARALVTEPDVLLLDEPTNHLDIEAITWLEGFLSKYSGTLIFVTHDRMFLQRLATRIIEIDRGRLLDWTCDYATFLVRKEMALAAEESQNALFDKKLAIEEVWVRTGIKARRVRNEGRVRALKRLRSERSDRRERIGNIRVEQHTDLEKSGQLVLGTKGLRYDIGGRNIIDNFSTVVTRGDKIGIIGPNGCGKTTLLRLLLGQLTATSGTVRQGTRIEVAYFDQLRAQLDETITVQENVSGGQTELMINGRKRHIVGYLEDFLFSAERSRKQARCLSGGERNRLMLAKLFAKASNVLVLDEPTNDLDAETLELLESLIVDYPGTVLMVSHDREFLNNVVTSTMVFEGSGVVREFVGGYDDWVRQRGEKQTEAAKPAKSLKSDLQPATPAASKGKKLSFKEQRELVDLPDRIAKLEREQEELSQMMSAPGFYQRSGGVISQTTQRMDAVSTELRLAFERWETLDAAAS